MMRLFILVAFVLSTAVSHEAHLRASNEDSARSKAKRENERSVGPGKRSRPARHMQPSRQHVECMQPCTRTRSYNACTRQCPPAEDNFTHLRASNAEATRSKAKRGNERSVGPGKRSRPARHMQPSRKHVECMQPCTRTRSYNACARQCPPAEEDFLQSSDTEGSTDKDVSELTDPSEGSQRRDAVDAGDVNEDPDVGVARIRNNRRNHACITNCVNGSSKTKAQCRAKCTGNEESVGPGKTTTAPRPCVANCMRNGRKTYARCDQLCPIGDSRAIA